jgi:hypothetical protein
MAKKKKWVVTTSGDRPMKDVEKDLKDCGFEVSDVLDAIGCVNGSGDDDAAEKARSIRGVTDVSPEPGDIDVGPPDAPITW